MPERANSPSVLIATLGSEPQVVTLTLDLLLGQDEGLQQVVAVHTAASQEPASTALRVLLQEWTTYPAYASLAFQRVEIVSDEGPVADVDSEAGAGATFRALYHAVRDAKRQGNRAHLSIAGGRKTMSVYGMVVAQLLFDEDDCLWHLVSSAPLLAERRLHPRPGDELRLVPVPVLRWSETPPMLTDLARHDDPFEAVQRQRELHSRTTSRRRATFVEQVLTPAEREAVACLVREGLTDRQIAAQLCKSERTIAHQLASAYDKAREYFGLDEVGRHRLIVLLGDYFR